MTDEEYYEMTNGIYSVLDTSFENVLDLSYMRMVIRDEYKKIIDNRI